MSKARLGARAVPARFRDYNGGSGRPVARALLLGAAGLLALVSVPATGFAQGVEGINRDAVDIEGRVGSLSGYLTENDQPRSEHPPYTERFADAELLYRLRDYGRAAVLFTDLVTNYRDTPAYSNSVFLLGESLYQAGDRLGARRYFREVVSNAQDPFFRPFVQRALGRLIEIALRTGNIDGIDEIFARLNQLPPTEIEAQTTYVRGKYYFLRRTPDYEQARQAFEAVPARSPIYPQARYFLGAILTAQERYPEAIEAFQRVLQIQVEGSEQQQVLDLAALAVGRLNIEQSNYDAAIEAYQQVGRSSPLFDRALFEQAWAFIRSGDAIRAERALEILSISNPDSPHIAEGKLLWGNLLLRTGRFDRAQQVFTEVRNQFGPVSQRLNELVAQNTDPGSYFQQLIQSNIQVFDTASFVPAPALAYVRQEGTLEQSLSVIADLNTCRRYIRESEDLIGRLNAALNSPSRAHVFRDLRRAREQVYQIQNRVTQARLAAAAVLDEASSGVNNPDLQGILAQRRQLEATVRRLPTNDAAIRRRDRAADGEFTQYSQELQRSEVQVANIEAMVVAIERYTVDHPSPTGGIDVNALRTEMTQHRGAIETYRQRIAELRRLINEGRSQVGVGDPRYERDTEVAREIQQLLQRQIEILRAAGRLPAGLEASLARLEAAERAARAFDERVNAVVTRRVATIQAQVTEEQNNVVGYRQRLAQLETEASDVVGHLVMASFASVRLHFYRIVMRADLGLVDVAWEIREEHNNRARMLAEEQNREIDALNDEFNEVVEGAEQEVRGSAPGSSAPASGGGSGASAPPAGGTPPPPTPAPTPTAGPAPASPSAAPATPANGGAAAQGSSR